MCVSSFLIFALSFRVRVSLCLALLCLACLLPLAHSRSSSSLASLVLLTFVSYSLLDLNGPEWVHSRRVG